MIDSQSVKTTKAGGPRGYDTGKKVMGRKRHALVDTDGRALKLLVHPADVQDRDGAVPLLKQSRSRHPLVEHAFADSAYYSARVTDVTSVTIEIVGKFADQTGSVVQPRSWVVARTFAWINRKRRSPRISSERSSRPPPSSTQQQPSFSSKALRVTHEIQNGL